MLVAMVAVFYVCFSASEKNAYYAAERARRRKKPFRMASETEVDENVPVTQNVMMTNLTGKSSQAHNGKKGGRSDSFSAYYNPMVSSRERGLSASRNAAQKRRGKRAKKTKI